jgi:predicted nucleic acid-binding protein
MEIEQRYAAQILPVDIEVARRWRELTALTRVSGIQIPANDGLIAATALQFGLHVMTRNSRHFASIGVMVIDPWQG